MSDYLEAFSILRGERDLLPGFGPDLCVREKCSQDVREALTFRAEREGRARPKRKALHGGSFGHIGKISLWNSGFHVALSILPQPQALSENDENGS
jgi:hypothetical protein